MNFRSLSVQPKFNTRLNTCSSKQDRDRTCWLYLSVPRTHSAKIYIDTLKKYIYFPVERKDLENFFSVTLCFGTSSWASQPLMQPQSSASPTARKLLARKEQESILSFHPCDLITT